MIALKPESGRLSQRAVTLGVIATDRSPRSPLPSAGRVLAVGSALPALVLGGWLLAGLPLLLLGWFRPLPMLLVGGASAVLLCRYGLRRMPEVDGSATAGRTAAVFGIAVASGVFNGIFHGEQLLVRRDPGTYAEYAVWLARHGSLPIPRGDFGGPDPALRFDGMGFYGTDDGILPQFMAGPPMIHAIGDWVAGIPGLLLVPPVLGALAVLIFAGTTARLVGARWAPPAALAFAVSLPVLYTSRTTFSEIPSLILIFGGLSLLADARRRAGADRAGAIAAALSGLLFGLALLVRIDGLRDVLPALPFAGLLIALNRISRSRARTRGASGFADADRRLGVPLLGGLAVGALWGLTACYTLAKPYAEYLSGSLKPLLGICAAVLVLTAAGTALAPWIAARRSLRQPVPQRVRRLIRWLPEAAAGLVVLVMAGLAVRPWVQTVHRVPISPEDRLTADFIEKTQEAGRLPIDGTRLYYEDSLHWVFWYVGVPAVVLATLTAAVLVRRLARGREIGWLLPLAIIGWTTLTTLWRPGITPDHPWASRRLVPVVIPGLILLAVWGLRWLRARARNSGRRRAGPLVAAAGAVLLVAPAAVTSIGTAFSPVNRGEAAAAADLCAAIPPNASVLFVERVTGDRFGPLVRGVCDVPAARVDFPPGTSVPLYADVARLIGKVRATGRVPVLLAAEAGQLEPYGTATRVVALRTRQDERSLVDPPDGTWSLSIDVWMTSPRS
ncbi:hypothetical protein ACFHYQ_22025 [Sphaerimonospora cavernae]|uniref:Glycosyltransferase RgtA/B/C/D-like domain-containing protein n=1 Tax=Sphaerimonospora cavernae TaxID=1740611 RepID=A0ABV6U9Y0_9ACTN